MAKVLASSLHTHSAPALLRVRVPSQHCFTRMLSPHPVFVIPSMTNPDATYGPPTGKDAVTSCGCSSVTYSLLTACSLCQGAQELEYVFDILYAWRCTHYTAQLVGVDAELPWQRYRQWKVSQFPSSVSGCLLKQRQLSTECQHWGPNSPVGTPKYCACLLQYDHFVVALNFPV